MKKNIFNFLKKYKSLIITAASVIIVGISGIIIFSKINDKISLNEFENEYYSLQYDSSWKIEDSEEEKILLTHNKDANLKIEIITLDNENRFLSIHDLIDEILFNLEQQNPDYKLISKKEDYLTKLQFDGFKILYENNENQLMVNVYKKSDKLIMFIYETTNDYFDILLDSVQNIVYNFNTKENTFDLKAGIELETSSVNLLEDNEIDSIIDETETYEIANNNYRVKYSLPTVFKLNEFNSTYNYFNLDELEGKNMHITASVMNVNIYEYIDKNNRLTLYEQYKYYREKDEYIDFEENLSKLESDYDSYIYKNSYYTNNKKYNLNFEEEEYKKYNENVLLIYALNSSHIFVIEISSDETGATKKLLDSIKINEAENYASYMQINSKDGFLLSELKRYSSLEKNKIISIEIKVPDTYEEYDMENNIFTDRYYGLNYNEENELYDYQIHFKFNYGSNTDEIAGDISSLFSSAHGEKNDLVKANNLTIGDKEFMVYNGGYTEIGGMIFTNIDRFNYYIHKKVLMYKLSDEKYLTIEISGNGKEITDKIITDATNFEIKEY